MRSRFETCCILRAELAEQAAKTWRNEFRKPVEPVSCPATLDGVNCRGALRGAQARDPQLKQSDLREYRQNPLDDVLERRVFLADARYWVPVMPDDSVPCLEPSKSWCRWAFELSHLTFVNPHRTAGETYQILRRLGYWKSLVRDLHQ